MTLSHQFTIAYNRQQRHSSMNVAEIYERLAEGPRLPLYESKVPAGFPSPAEAFVKNRLNAHDYLVLNDTSTVFIRVKGDSMTGALIHDGDIIAVDKSIEEREGDIVVAIVDNEYTVKYLGHNCLIPANPDFPTIHFLEPMTVRIFGVVVGTMRRFR